MAQRKHEGHSRGPRRSWRPRYWPVKWGNAKYGYHSEKGTGWQSTHPPSTRERGPQRTSDSNGDREGACVDSPSALMPSQKAPQGPRPVHPAVLQHPPPASQEMPPLNFSKVELPVPPPDPPPPCSLSSRKRKRLHGPAAAPTHTLEATFPFPPSPNLFHQPDLSGSLSKYVCSRCHFLCTAVASSLVSLPHCRLPRLPSLPR